MTRKPLCPHCRETIDPEIGDCIDCRVVERLAASFEAEAFAVRAERLVRAVEELVGC